MEIGPEPFYYYYDYYYYYDCFLGLIFTTAKLVFITSKVAFIFTSLSVVHIFTVITN